MKRFSAVLGFALLLCFSSLAFGQGIATVVGQVMPSNEYANASRTGLAGTVTNPTTNTVINISGGPIYCNGGLQQIAQTAMTLAINNTYLVVYNCLNQSTYAKQAVTGPGSPSTSSGASVNQPGYPNQVLYPVPGVEIPLATVVCGTTYCGDSSNGSITEARPLAAFPAGLYAAGHLNTSLANTDIAGVCTLGTNCAITFANAYQNTPACVATDSTTADATKAAASTSGVTFTGNSTDVLAWICVGNPN